MQTNDPSAEPTIIETRDAASAEIGDLGEPASGRGRRRRPRDGQTERISPRFKPADRAEVDAAAASAGMSTSRFGAEAALAAAPGTPMLLAAAQDRGRQEEHVSPHLVAAWHGAGDLAVLEPPARPYGTRDVRRLTRRR